MLFKIDLNAPTAVWRQICEQVKYAVATGALAPGDRLPAIRQIAVQTRVNRNTIAKAFTELEREGVIVSRQGHGSFVADNASLLQKQQRVKILEEQIRGLFVQAYHFQIEPPELQQIIDRVGKKFGKESQDHE